MQDTAAGCAPHVLVLHLAEAVLGADAAATLSRVLIQERLQHSLQQQTHMLGRRLLHANSRAILVANAVRAAMGHALRAGSLVAAHLDGVTVRRRNNIQVQVAISQVAIADCLQAVRPKRALTMKGSGCSFGWHMCARCTGC